jgi:hypothetical protein
MSFRDKHDNVLCHHGRPFSCGECGEEYAAELDAPFTPSPRSGADPDQRIAELTTQRDMYRTLAGIGVWHQSCRPNREMAARELQKSQAVIDKLADEITRLQAGSGAVPRLRIEELIELFREYEATSQAISNESGNKMERYARACEAATLRVVIGELSALLEGITREENDTRHDRQSASGPTGSSR